MKKQNRIKWMITLIIVIVIIIGGAIIASKIKDSTVSANELKSKNDNTISFDCGYFDKYVHLSLEVEESENIEKINYEIINPKEKVVASGVLDKNKISDTLEGEKGEWKIKLDFSDENEKALIKYNIKINSKKDN